MSVVRRAGAGAVVAVLVLLGGPAWAQEDPCAPGADGQVPESCQGSPEPAPGPSECPGQPVEPGDGVVTDGGGDEGVAVGEPHPDAPPSDVVEEGEPKPEPVEPEQSDPVTAEEPTMLDAPVNSEVGDDGLVCAFAAPVSAPAAAAPESAAVGGVTAARQLPRTGAYDRLLATVAVGLSLMVVGAGIAAAGRRRIA